MPTITLRIDDRLHALLETAAREDGRSINKWTARAIEASVLRQAMRNKLGELAAHLDKAGHAPAGGQS